MTRAPHTRRSVYALALTLAALSLGCADDRPPSVSGQPIDDVPPFDAVLPVFDAQPLDGSFAPRGVNPYPRYDLSFVLPHNGPEQAFNVDVEPRAGKLDVHFSIDTTGSFGGEIQALKTSLQDILIPQLRMRVVDLAIGVSRFGDFPVAPYGLPGDRPYDLLTPVTTDFDRVTRAVFSLDRPLQNGGDVPESWLEALYQIGTGAGYTGVSGGAIERFAPSPSVPGGGALGGVGFREGSARVVVNVTDASSHDPFDYGGGVPGTHTLEQTAAALRGLGVRLIGVASGEPARAQMQALAIATNAVVVPESGRCLTGVLGFARPPVGGVCPLVFDISPDGSGLARSTLDAITRFLDSLAFRTVTSATDNDPQGFVTAVEALSAVPPAGGAAPRREDRQPTGRVDGVLDTFTEVTTRTRLTFRVHVRNTRTMSLELPQLFFLRVSIVGDGVVLGSYVIRVIVPEGPKPDSGVDVSRDRSLGDTSMPLEGSVDAGGDLGADLPPDLAETPDLPVVPDAPDASDAGEGPDAQGPDGGV